MDSGGMRALESQIVKLRGAPMLLKAQQAEAVLTTAFSVIRDHENRAKSAEKRLEKLENTLNELAPALDAIRDMEAAGQMIEPLEEDWTE